ncbi:MAG: hypothetical protein QOE90_2107 [Thermoplasmata archaeon]|jgi:hypothetical protein|nr:hypothetical protein [Thermoplasmata archaeon]
MHDLLEAHCPACGFVLRGVTDDGRLHTCGLCGLPLAMRANYSISRRLPVGMGLLMGAFAASHDASPLLAQQSGMIPGFAKRWQ